MCFLFMMSKYNIQSKLDWFIRLKNRWKIYWKIVKILLFLLYYLKIKKFIDSVIRDW